MGNVLSIERNALIQNKTFTVSCQALGDGYCGNISSIYSSIPYVPFNITFSVSLSKGTSYTTDFVFNVVKDLVNKVKCEFGFVDELTGNLIEL